MELLVIIVVIAAFYFGKEVGRQESQQDETVSELRSEEKLPR